MIWRYGMSKGRCEQAPPSPEHIRIAIITSVYAAVYIID